MAKKLEEITATYIRERFRFESLHGDVVIGAAQLVDNGDAEVTDVTVKGVADEDGPSPHQTYRFFGSWTDYHNARTRETERQFHFKTFVRKAPHSRAGVVRYLEKAPGIGRVIAAKLFDEFGPDAVRVLRESPDVASEKVKKLNAEKAAEASSYLVEQQALEDCTIELMEMLDGRGFPQSVAKAAVKRDGNRAAARIKRDPYSLMQFRGCGFKKADALYLDLGHPPQSLKRQALCAAYAVTTGTSSSGSTWQYAGVAEQGIKGNIGSAEPRVKDALRLAERGRILVSEWTDGLSGPPSIDGDTRWVADARKANNESRVARYVAGADSEPGWRSLDLGELKNLSEHQRRELSHATQGGSIGILGGSPGTGKTYTAAALILSLIDCFGEEGVAVCAPTGKAAVRVTEAMAYYGIAIQARTIHSLLGVQQVEDRGGWTFEHDAANPLDFAVLIVDESSMIDTDLMAAFLAARRLGTKVLFVGDINQLLPVGHGAPLRDMILAGLPYGELTEIRRNAGAIVEACAAIRNKMQFGCGGNLRNGIGHTAEQQIDRMMDIICDTASQIKVDKTWDFQVLCAVNQRSALARKELNKHLQMQLNPSPEVPGSPFRFGDKVVCLKNGFCGVPKDYVQPPDEEVKTNSRGEVYVANGEIGRVTKVEPKFTEIELLSPRRKVFIPRGNGNQDGEDQADSDDASATGCNWDLAYALSVHKSQGSEFRFAIVMLDEYPDARKICDRSWLYTAISRARECCWLVGKLATAQRMTTVDNVSKRKTFLKERIHDEISRRRTLPLLPPQEECEAHG